MKEIKLKNLAAKVSDRNKELVAKKWAKQNLSSGNGSASVFQMMSKQYHGYNLCKKMATVREGNASNLFQHRCQQSKIRDCPVFGNESI